MKLTKKLKKQYSTASKGTKGQILEQYCTLTHIQRNTAIKRFSRIGVLPELRPNKKKYEKYHKHKKGASKQYLSIHYALLKQCWNLSGHICGERLKPILSTCLEQLVQNNKLTRYQEHDIQTTKNMSEITIKRAIHRFLIASPPHKQWRGKKKATELYGQIPIKAHFGEYATIGSGYIEVDYVEHNGGNVGGQFGITGNYTDVSSQWVVRSANKGKSLASITTIHDIAIQRIYHPIKEYHPDNAPTILSLLFYRMKQDIEKTQKKQYKLSRSRPYKKNDNAHVEQKNRDKIRKVVGHHRIDTDEEIQILNRLYEKMDLYDNFFIPSKKLIHKEIDEKGKLIRKVYDKPKTPYQRIQEDQTVDEVTKVYLREMYVSLNMVQLRKEIDEILKELSNAIGQKPKK